MIASIDITGIQYNVSEKMQKYVTDRVGKLDRYVPAHARKSLVADVKLRQVNRDHGNKYEAEIIEKEFLRDNEYVEDAAALFGALPLVPDVTYYSCRNFVLLRKI